MSKVCHDIVHVSMDFPCSLPHGGAFSSQIIFVNPIPHGFPLVPHEGAFSSLITLVNPIPQASEAGAIPMPANAIREEAEMAHGEAV